MNRIEIVISSTKTIDMKKIWDTVLPHDVTKKLW